MAKKIRYDDYPERDDQRRAIYTEYSSRFLGELGKPQDAVEIRERRQRTFLKALAAVGCLSLVAVGFFVTYVMLYVSREPPMEDISGQRQENPSTVQVTQTTTQPPKKVSFENAMIAPEAALGGGRALDNFIQKAKDEKAQAVIFNLKNTVGDVLYPSQVPQAGRGKILGRSVEEARESVAAAKKAGLQTVVSISCFRDTLAPRAIEGAAVRYAGNTKILWLDNSLENGGKPWLNPYSKEARDYLLALISELVKWKPDGIYITDVQFPSGPQYAAAFLGENDGPSRNEQLRAFIKSAKKAAGNITLLCEMESQAVINELGAKIYDGDLWDSDADVLVIPVTKDAEIKLVETAAPKGAKWVTLF
ncbi:MAG: hypothetical protein FWG82_05650 [Oscillospiraceae bacterium]|nr:hypothetical protein [Oscillospiraceae bacterium]